jgi:hypothetical protein
MAKPIIHARLQLNNIAGMGQECSRQEREIEVEHDTRRYTRLMCEHPPQFRKAPEKHTSWKDGREPLCAECKAGHEVVTEP